MNTLSRLNDFQTVLQSYTPSVATRQLLTKIRLVLLVGPSSSGRNTIINRLLESGKYHVVVSDTTRQPRENNGVLEQNGREYWFRSEAELLQDLKDGAFLEAAVIHQQQVSGISVRELVGAANKGLVAINEIEPVGADNVHAAKPDTLFLFTLPPSFDEWMARMSARGALPADEIQRRLQSAVNELTMALERDYYYFVVNDTFSRTAGRIDNLIMNNVRSEDQIANKQVARQLLEDTTAFLSAKAV